MKKAGKGSKAQGLGGIMHQGGSRRGGEAATAGNTRAIMAQGSSPKHSSPCGNLGRIMGQ